ncbi:unnamed protein product, partial [Heterosigma akashiwo]
DQRVREPGSGGPRLGEPHRKVAQTDEQRGGEQKQPSDLLGRHCVLILLICTNRYSSNLGNVRFVPLIGNRTLKKTTKI